MVWIYTTKVYFQILLLKTLGVLSTTCSYVCWSEKLHTFKGIQQYSNSQRSIDTNKVLYYTLLFEGRQKILKIQNLLYEKQYIFFERISLLVCDCVYVIGFCRLHEDTENRNQEPSKILKKGHNPQPQLPWRIVHEEIKMWGEHFAKLVTNLFLVIASHHLSSFFYHLGGWMRCRNIFYI